MRKVGSRSVPVNKQKHQSQARACQLENNYWVLHIQPVPNSGLEPNPSGRSTQEKVNMAQTPWSNSPGGEQGTANRAGNAKRSS